jgi:hypothetical protein
MLFRWGRVDGPQSGWAYAVGVLNRLAFAGSAFVRAAGSPDDQG